MIKPTRTPGGVTHHFSFPADSPTSQEIRKQSPASSSGEKGRALAYPRPGLSQAWVKPLPFRRILDPDDLMDDIPGGLVTQDVGSKLCPPWGQTPPTSPLHGSLIARSL